MQFPGSGKAKSKTELQKHDIVLTSFTVRRVSFSFCRPSDLEVYCIIPIPYCQTLALEYTDPEIEEKAERKRRITKRQDDSFIASDSEDEVTKKKAKQKKRGFLLDTEVRNSMKSIGLRYSRFGF